MKDYKHIEHMRNLNDSLIWERMKRYYDYGYEDGKADTPFTDTEEAEKRGMTLTEYLESINPLNEANKIDAIKDIPAESEVRNEQV